MKLQPKKVALFFLTIVMILISAHIMGLVTTFILGHEYVFGLVPLFNLGIEGNIPSLYSSIALLFSAVLLSIITLGERKKGDSNYIYWLGLTIIFLLLSLDEFVSLHERLNEPVQNLLNNPDTIYIGWLIPMGIAVIIFASVYLKFLQRLPKNIRNLVIISGAIYVSGALGFEIIEELQIYLSGKDNILYSIIYTCEESFEMLAIVLFIYTLSSYIDRYLSGLYISTKRVTSLIFIK